jgi:hypothetical protein
MSVFPEFSLICRQSGITRVKNITYIRIHSDFLFLKRKYVPSWGKTRLFVNLELA